MTTLSSEGTVLDALVDALEAASVHNSQDQVSPAAVLWTDEGRQWEVLLPRLRERLPLFVLGKYSPDQGVGPAYWLRCIIARTIQHPGLLPEQVPVLYLPGYSRQDLRDLETCPTELRPLAELRYRGVLWSQKNGRDWTVSSFLQNKDGGLGIAVESDSETRESLRRSLLRLSEEPVEALLQIAPLRSTHLDGLMHPNNVREVLRWLNDPEGYRRHCSEQEWAAFVALCETHYEFAPDRHSPVSAAGKLGGRDGNWEMVWQRFAEAPGSYSGIPDRLREAKPQVTLPLLDHVDSWPQNNETAEAALRDALLELSNLDSRTAGDRILQLEQEHGPRRDWVWASLRVSPLAQVIGHLETMVKGSERKVWGTTVAEIMEGYAGAGWEVDLAVLDALASVERLDDVVAVRSAVRTVYRPWLESMVRDFQKAVATSIPVGYEATLPAEVANGTCLLFVDGLRFDLARRLGMGLERREVEVTVEPCLTALPSVTATAKPAVSPVSPSVSGGTGFDTVLGPSRSKVTAQLLRSRIADVGFEILGAEDYGDTSGRAWSETGEIDQYGHNHGWMVAHHAVDELRRLADRVIGLLDHGWEKVVLVTDHGWLLMPGGLPKAELPEHLTEARKGRCARLKEGSQTDQQVVAWHWDQTVRIAVAPGIHCYEAGKDYEHGGLSPQECVVPVLTAAKRPSRAAVPIVQVVWSQLGCNISIGGTGTGLWVDVRTKSVDPSTTVAMGGKEIDAGGEALLRVKDADREGEAAFVVVVGRDGTVLGQTITIVGQS